MNALSKRIKQALVQGLTASVLISAPAMADDRDSNADATFNSITASVGALIRVPINSRGEEDTDAAELRVYDGDGGTSVNAAALPTIWNAATTMDPSTVAPEGSAADSSTSWWGWNRWGHRGWRSPYYYYNYYSPSFNYYGNYYNYYGYTYPYYTYPTYYNVYSPFSSYYGYRYYYYPRYW